MIEQDNFTYSLLRITEYYIIMIESQVEKQIKGDEKHGKELVKPNAFVEKNCEQKELFSDLTVGRMNTVDKLHNSIDFNNIIYRFKGSTADINFNSFIDATSLLSCGNV